MMRYPSILGPILGSIALGACASGGANVSTAPDSPTAVQSSVDSPFNYQAEFDALQARCRTRGGFLLPTGAGTGRAGTDYVCQIRPGGSSDAFTR